MSGFTGQIRDVQPGDAGCLDQILRHWLGREAGATLSRVLAMGDEIHLVAVDHGRVLGVMGLEFEDIRPPLFSPEDKPASLISAYVDPGHRGRGVGSVLADHLEAMAVGLGCTRLVIVSGARSRESGYGFWMSRYGEPAHYEPDAFGPGMERVAWSVALPTKSPQPAG